MMRCPACGARVSERDRACFLCHHVLNQQQPAGRGAAERSAGSADAGAGAGAANGGRDDDAIAAVGGTAGSDGLESVDESTDTPPIRTLTGPAPVAADPGPDRAASQEETQQPLAYTATYTITAEGQSRTAPDSDEVAGRQGVREESVGPLRVEVLWGRKRIPAAIPVSGATIGSGIEADIRLRAAFLAPVHARIVMSDGAWIAEPAAVDAVVVHRGTHAGPAIIQHGDIFRIADRVGNAVTVRVLSSSRPRLHEGALRALLPGPGESYLIGSDPSCAVRLDHPLVQRRHAALRREDGGSLWLEDRGTAAGTYVQGQRLRGRRRLASGDIIQIGPFSAMVGRVALEPLEQVAGVDITCHDAGVAVRERNRPPRALLRRVRLRLEPASLTAIVGPSGAGKTTLMRMLSGQLAPTEGSVRYNGVDLGECRERYGELTGFVPQDDVVHLELRVTEALTYQARLRLGLSTSEAQRAARVETLLTMLGLTDQRDQQVGTLSGGQRKRVSIACELLKEPQLLFLDEPTSGLDPGLDKRMMLLLRLLADQGRTVVLTTHAIANVDVCDTLILLGPGGYVIYAGAPAAAAESFGVASLGDVFALVETPEAAEAAAGHAASHVAARAFDTGSTQAPSSRTAAPAMPPAPARVGLDFGSSAWRRAFAEQGRTFAGRQVRLLGRDRSALGFTLLQGVVVAVLTSFVAPRPFTWSVNSNSAVFVFGCASVWFGMIGAVRELVKERVIWRREFSAGADLYAYLAAKLGVLGALAFVQSLTLTLVLALTLHLPATPPIGPSFGAVLLTLWLANLTGVAGGLVVSATSRTADRALSLVPYLLILQLVLCGVLFHLGALTPVSWLVPARWAVSALGGVAGLSAAQLHQASGLYPASATGLAGNWTVLVLIAAAGIAATLWSLQRQASSWRAGFDEPTPLLRSARAAARARGAARAGGTSRG